MTSASISAQIQLNLYFELVIDEINAVHFCGERNTHELPSVRMEIDADLKNRDKIILEEAAVTRTPSLSFDEPDKKVA